MHEAQYPIRIGYLSSFAPFCATGSDGPEGLVVDQLDSCFAVLELEVLWSPTSLDEQLDHLLGGRIDLIAALGVTDERRQVVSFTRPLVETGGALFSRRGEAASVSRRGEAAPGLAASIVTPGAGPLVESARKCFPAAEILLVDGYAEALMAVLDGVADAAALNLHVGIELVERSHPGRFRLPDRPFEELTLAAAFASGHLEDVRRRLDDVIARPVRLNR